jgi:hypothetical protein
MSSWPMNELHREWPMNEFIGEWLMNELGLLGGILRRSSGGS